jgi:hypothetical protein
MPTGTVVGTNADGSLRVRTADGQIKNVARGQAKPVATAPAAPAAPAAQDAISAPPAMGTRDWFRQKGYAIANKALPLLPAVGGTVGGLVGGMATGPGAVAGAPLGAAGGGAMGEGVRELLTSAIFGNDELPTTRGGTAKQMAEQAGMNAAAELTARGTGKVFSKLASPFEKSAQTVRDAVAGNGVRLTPGEASGSKGLQMVEGAAGHVPGAMGPLHTFRAAQEQEAEALLEKQLDALSTQKLTPEQTGNAVKQVIANYRKQAIGPATAKFEEVKQLLGRAGENLSPEELDAAVQKQAEFYKGFGQSNAETVKKLEAARNAWRDARKTVDIQTFAKILKTNKPEIIGSYVRNAGLDELRILRTVMPPQVQQNVARSTLESMLDRAADPQTGALGYRDLAKSLKSLGEGRGRIIFGQQYEQVMDASRLLNKIQAGGAHSTQGQMHTMRMLIALGSTAGLVLGMTHSAVDAAVSIGGEVGAMRLIAQALTRPGVSAAMLRAMRTAAAGAIRAVPYGVDELTINERKPAAAPADDGFPGVQ